MTKYLIHPLECLEMTLDLMTLSHPIPINDEIEQRKKYTFVKRFHSICGNHIIVKLCVNY